MNEMKLPKSIATSIMNHDSRGRKWIGFVMLLALGTNVSLMGFLSFGRSKPHLDNTMNDSKPISEAKFSLADALELLQEQQNQPPDVDLQAQMADMDMQLLSATGGNLFEPHSNLRIDGRRLQEEPPAPMISREKYLGLIFPEPEKMPRHLRNTMEPLHEDDLIFFWHIPKAAGGLMKVIMGTCYGLRRAEKLTKHTSMEMIKDTVLNVDTATPDGIKEAQGLSIADSGMVDVIVSSYVLSGSSLFTHSHRGRAFTLLRHPVDTAASLFLARKGPHPDLRKFTMAEYVNQTWYPDNWMVRQMTGTLPGYELTEYHLDRAKNLLSAKIFVGIVEQMEETMRQLRMYYGWKELPGKEGCSQQLVRGSEQAFKPTTRPRPKRGSDDWITITQKEKWDLELYYFGLELFSRQSTMFPSAAQEATYL